MTKFILGFVIGMTFGAFPSLQTAVWNQVSKAFVSTAFGSLSNECHCSPDSVCMYSMVRGTGWFGAGTWVGEAGCSRPQG